MRKPPIQANKTVDKKKVPKKIILGNKIRKRVLKQLTLGKTYRLMMLRMRRKFKAEEFKPPENFKGINESVERSQVVTAKKRKNLVSRTIHEFPEMARSFAEPRLVFVDPSQSKNYAQTIEETIRSIVMKIRGNNEPEITKGKNFTNPRLQKPEKELERLWGKLESASLNHEELKRFLEYKYIFVKDRKLYGSNRLEDIVSFRGLYTITSVGEKRIVQYKPGVLELFLKERQRVRKMNSKN